MRCLAVCQDELVIRMLDEILLPGFEIEFIVELKPLAKRLHDAGVSVIAADPRRTDAWVKADLGPSTCVIIEDNGRRSPKRILQAVRDAGPDPSGAMPVDVLLAAATETATGRGLGISSTPTIRIVGPLTERTLKGLTPLNMLLDEIAAVKGLDGLFVGPSDLTIALTDGGSLDRSGAATIAAMGRVAEVCKAQGLVAGAFAGTPDFCRAYAALGFRFMAGPTDTDLLNRGAEAFLKATAPN